MRKSLPYIITIFAIIMILLSPERSIGYARGAIAMCGEIIIPSLFPFFVCSGLLIYSGFAESLSRLFRPVMKPLFNVNACGAAAFVLGLLSGYPLGALSVCQLYSSGYLSRSEAERLLAFCNNSGPLFILGAVGTAIYSNPKIGVILYCSHILAAVSVGILFRFYKRDKYVAPAYAINRDEKSFPETFSQVLANSIISILTVCGAVIFFSVVSNIAADFLPEGSIVRPILIGILELTGGVREISNMHLSLTSRLFWSAFTVGFAGLCVHLQVMAIASSHGLSLKPYLLGKLAHGVLAAFYTLLALKLFPSVISVFSNGENSINIAFFASSAYCMITVVLLAALSVILMLNKSQKKL